MNRFERFLAYAESHRPIVWALSGGMIALIVAGDWILPNVSVGFLYLLPVLFAAATLNGVQIAAMAALCGYLREAFDPLQLAAAPPGTVAPAVFNPLHWAPGAGGRLIVVTAG